MFHCASLSDTVSYVQYESFRHDLAALIHGGTQRPSLSTAAGSMSIPPSVPSPLNNDSTDDNGAANDNGSANWPVAGAQASSSSHSEAEAVGVYITLRMRLRCELLRNGWPVPGKTFDVLNEVVVDRGSNPYLCKIECYERNRLITKVSCLHVCVQGLDAQVREKSCSHNAASFYASLMV